MRQERVGKGGRGQRAGGLGGHAAMCEIQSDTSRGKQAQYGIACMCTYLPRLPPVDVLQLGHVKAGSSLLQECIFRGCCCGRWR